MPYPNEHAARLQDPSKFETKSFRRTNGGIIYGNKRVPKTIAIIWGKLKGKSKPSDKPIPQSLRFPIKYWSAEKAKKWLKDNKIKYISFEPAAKKKESSENVTKSPDIRNDININVINGDSIFALMAQFEAEMWVMEQRALVSFFSHLNKMSSEIKAARTAADNKYKIIDGTAHIPIKGILIKHIPRIFGAFGIEATSYETIIEQVRSAIGDNKVKNIQLDVDSPGGLVNGVMEAADTIRAARDITPITAVVDEMAASGAYWLASQANSIITERNSMVGSIGVFSVYIDSSKMAEDRGLKVHVIKSSPHKGTGVPGAPITNEQLEPIQEIIDGMANNFVKSVSLGRDKPIKDVRAWATGQMYLADKALNMGLIDEIYKTSTQIQNSMKGLIMPEKSEQDQVDAQIEVNKLTEQVQGEERSRLSKLRSYFSNDLEFALKAFEAGQTLPEAKADYCDILKEKIAALEKELATAKEQKEKKEVSTGVSPIETSNSDGAGSSAGEPDFLEQAREMAAKENITMTKAMSKLSRTRPDLHKAFKEKGAA